MKTISLKKVSAVAVAALGFGLLSVVPANAAITQTGTITGVTDGTTSHGVSVVYNAGTAITATINIATATTMSSAGDYINASVAVTGPSLASPAATNVAVTSTLTACTTTATLSCVAAGTTLTGSWISTALTTAQALGTVSFTPSRAGLYTITLTPLHAKVAGTVDTGATLTAVTKVISVGGDAVLAPTVGTSITANNAAVGQSNGLTTYRFQPAGFTKDAAAVTTYYATVDAGSIESVTNGANAGGTGGIQAMTSSLTNGVNSSAGYKLISTIGTNAATWNAGAALSVVPGYWDITLNGSTATTQTLTVKQLNTTTGAITTVATAVSTYGAAPAISVAYSTSILNGTTTTGATSDATVVASKSAAQVANVAITLKDQYAVALYGQTLTATVSGPGLITFNQSSATQTGSARAAALVLTSSQNTAYLGLSADGTAGVGTITIAVGTTVIGTETFKFYGAPATLTATQKLTTASKSGAALGTGVANPAGTTVAATPAVILVAKDSNGVVVPGLTITAKSSDVAVMSETITINGDDGTGLGNGLGSGYYNVAVNSVASTSGKTATLTFRTLLSDGTYVSAAPLTFTLGGAVDTVALSLDKTSYTVGSAAVVTLTLKDSSGNAAFDADHASILTAALSTSLSVTKTLAFNATATSVTSVGGKSTVSFNAPATAVTEWIVKGTTGTGPGTDIAKALSATAAVTDGSGALLTQIASLNAKIVALNALIAKIMKRLNIR